MIDSFLVDTEVSTETGQVQVLGAVGFGSYELAKLLGADKLGEWGSEKLFNFMHRNDPYFSNGKMTTVVHTSVNMDGQKVAHVVTQHQARAVMGPQTGISDFDSRMFAIPPGALSY
jgi:hypothetical protein